MPKKKGLDPFEELGYKLLKDIGKGAYATVFLAHSLILEADVAIKQIRTDKAPPDYLKKFLPREIKILGLLAKSRHENVIHFYHRFNSSRRQYLVLELAPNGDLLDEVTKRKRIDEAQAGIWFSQFVDGMAHVHSLGIVHRDLKCENLLLDKHRNIKITDFGFAREVSLYTEETGMVDLSKTFCGSFAYAAPEIISGIPYNSYKSDIWSMGVVCYTMLYGKVPFDDTRHKQLIEQVHKGVKIDSSKSGLVSPEGVRLIHRLLVPSPKSRIPMDEIKADPWYLKYSGNKNATLKAKLERFKELMAGKKSTAACVESAPAENQTNHVSQNTSTESKWRQVNRRINQANALQATTTSANTKKNVKSGIKEQDKNTIKSLAGNKSNITSNSKEILAKEKEREQQKSNILKSKTSGSKELHSNSKKHVAKNMEQKQQRRNVKSGINDPSKYNVRNTSLTKYISRTTVAPPMDDLGFDRSKKIKAKNKINSAKNSGKSTPKKTLSKRKVSSCTEKKVIKEILPSDSESSNVLISDCDSELYQSTCSVLSINRESQVT